MGLDNRLSGSYFSVLDGKFCQRVIDGTVGSKQRKNKIGKLVSEKFYDEFTGKLVAIKTKDSEYGKNWIFSFKDQKDTYHLQLGYTNGFAVGLLKILPNVDLTKEMKVSVSTKEVDNKKKNSIFVAQDGKVLKHAFTKDKPNGLPPMEQITVKGELIWDGTKQMIFLENMVNTAIVPKLEGVKEAVAVDPLEKTVSELEADVEDSGF